MKTLHMLHSLDLKPGETGTTVRLGDKWNVPPNTPLELCVCVPYCHIEGYGATVSTWMGRFKDVPACLIENEHELESRRYSGLKASMERAYGNLFNEDSVVTVLSYQRAAL